MSKHRLRAGLVLLLFTALIPLSYLPDYIDRNYFSDYSIIYDDRGIGFSGEKHTRFVTGIWVFPDETKDSQREEDDKFIIIPGQGVGNIRFGDSIDWVERESSLDWVKYVYPDRTILSNSRFGVSLTFADGKLGNITISGSEYRTREGVGVGDRKSEVRNTYGEPFLDWVYPDITILGKMTRSVLVYLIIGIGFLALVNKFLAKKGDRGMVLFLIPVAVFIFAALQQIPVGIYEWRYLVEVRLADNMISYPAFLFVFAAPTATFAGILLGQFFARCYRLKGLVRHVPAIVGGYLSVMLIIIAWQIFKVMLGDDMFFPFSWMIVLLVYGSVFYLFWYQFNRLFGVYSGYLVYRPREI